MKGQKGEGTKQNQLKGSTERGPLFPRLHVNETEKAGPKAPPRNKMALYEQFTVPSHRFVQSSQKPATAMYQQQYGVRELVFPYVPYYIPTGPNHGAPMYAQPSHNTSSSGIVSGGVVNDELWKNTPRHHNAGKSSPGRVSRYSTEVTAGCSVKCLPEEKDKDAIVAAQSSLTNQVEESTSSFQNTQCDMEGPHITDITVSLQEALSTVEVGTECTGPDLKICEWSRGRFSTDRARRTCAIDEGKLKQGAQRRIFETLTQQAKETPLGPSEKSAVQSCLQIESSRDECKDDRVTEAMKSHAHCTTLLEPKSFKSLEERTSNAGCQSFLSPENQVVTRPQSAPTSAEILEKNVHKNAFKNLTTDVGTVVDRVGKPSIASPEEFKIIQNRNSEASQTPQRGTFKEGHSDGLTGLDPMWVIKPKDVIRAVGQQQFWKARKKLLRQQRIFSDQVFQLHKFIKIQHLLAETPGTLLDEEMHFEMIEEFDASTPSAKGATTNTSEDANRAGFNIKEGRKGKSSETEGELRNKLGQTQADPKLGPGSSKCMPELGSAGVSAWGYPSLGPWVGPMAAQGGPFHYQPFAGALPPGSAFGLPYGPTLPGSVASMMSIGIPHCDQRQELPAEMDANYGPSTAFKHEGSGTVSFNSNHVSNDLAASWYFAQYNHLNNQRLLAGGFGKDAPTGSGASVNKSSAPAQPAKPSCFPGLSYQWAVNCQTGPLNTDGLESSAHHSENSSPSSATGRNCHTSSSTPPTPSAKSAGLSHHDAGGLAQNLDPPSGHRFNRLDQYGRGKMSAEIDKLVTRTQSQSKCPMEAAYLPADCPSSDGNDHSSDLNPCALDLFPLVPSLSPNGCTGGRVLKTVEKGQAGVIRAVPRRSSAASKSAAGILLSLQQERQK